MAQVNYHYEQGYTLIELLIAVALAVLALGALGYQMSAQLTANRAQLRMQKTTADLRSVLDIIAQDLKRAGFASTTDQAVITAFSQKSNYTLYQLTQNTPVTCVTFAYDRDSDGALDANEGFAYAFDSANKTIRAYQGATPNCSNLTAAGWTALTNPAQTAISSLTFTLQAPGTPATAPTETQKGVCPFNIAITISGESVQKSGTPFTGTQTLLVKVRNDSSSYLSGSNCNYPTPTPAPAP
ncbi:prepilin-type N-terminal cleavage/methylation domain-containing protein [Chitinilyticum piscinae]|uniref:Prepilin-type N-terminal cleavage/methylation domain-containing protein n=1 Tax=Chitinilyticum piscinae TaxID=2866724 RepID=A0A8J7FKJ2_9NEIS|nr:prepilin-type N-terminal cleavage/methylation domain-containing protein [Chitinilyticum piscinae]MBE9607771.1 prepilin-type N-terminal cleavage/methylation domain-containing protein [Chitinilyticum piscinae]